MLNTKRKINKLITVSLLGIFCLIGEVQAANLFVSPSSGEYQNNKNIIVGVYVSSSDQALNAISGTLNFPADKLEVVSVSKSGSVINLWVKEPSFSNQSGTVSFEGIVLNPGYTGGSTLVLNITFKIKNIGNASLNLASAQVLANDGTGTNITKNVGGATFSLKVPEIKPTVPTEPKVTPPTGNNISLGINSTSHPDQTKWYNNNSLEFTWEKISGVSAVNLSLSLQGEENDGKTYSPAVWSKSINDVNDGVYYFYVQPKIGQTWGKETSYKVQIDTVAPADLSLEMKDGNVVVLNGTDTGSGIEKYILHFSDGDILEIPTTIESNVISYTLSNQFSGKEIVSLEAVDRADNLGVGKIPATEISIQLGVGPQITDFDEKIKVGGILYVKGDSNPSSRVAIFLEHNGIVEKYETVSNITGRFTYVWDDPAQKGVYKIWAKEIINEVGGVGASGNQIFVQVSESKLLKTLYKILEYTAVIALILSIVLLFITFVVIVYRKVFKYDTNKYIKKNK